ncbi:MAG: MFS transporter [Verrucomicrobiae bacterium]|nr:MFS transporter [Verrucomicrobiae bacterium]
MNRGNRLFVASCLALIVTAMSFAIRADIMGELGQHFSLTHEQVGWVAGTAFWGFTLAMIFGGPLCDTLGMGRLVTVAFVGHVVGVLVTIFAQGFWTLFLGTLAIGLANGLVEAACNPLVTALFPDKKVEKLNQFHVWFPGGIVIGGLAAYFLAMGNMGWQVKMAVMLIPTLAYGVMFFGQKFPQTERVEAGVSTGDMYKAVLAPIFLVMVFCMLLTASTELGPNQWIPSILTTSAGVSGILVLVWINGLMAVGREFAGPIVHRISPVVLLLISSFFAAVGLLSLSFAQGGLMTFAAATVFAVGVCYFWPTMLGVVAERVPKSGALGLAIMGGAGMMSVSWILPIMGRIYDAQIKAALPLGATPEMMPQDIMAQATAEGGAATLRYVVILPLTLCLIFGAMYLRDRMKGGYKAEKI